MMPVRLDSSILGVWQFVSIYWEVQDATLLLGHLSSLGISEYTTLSDSLFTLELFWDTIHVVAKRVRADA